ncbi:TPA: hypothetical protein ACIYWE_004284 [Escherichia coli]|nr:hypothetical protein [Escherichia coli]MGR76137.1 hypothetical protein [Escherichia coli]HAM5439683.1 hypothetical protein [Escherichia coli]
MSKPGIELTAISISPDDISTNLQVGVIVVSEDKLVRILEKDRERTRKNMAWTAPASFFITLLVAILTTDFKTRWGMPAEAWQALFYFGTFLSAMFAVFYFFRVKRKDMSELIEEIKGK